MTDPGAASMTDIQSPHPQGVAETTSVTAGEVSGRSGAAQPWWRHNSEVAWDRFNPEAYWNHNYRSFRDDDREILRTVGRHFRDCFDAQPDKGCGQPGKGRRGLDVGSGANLYPALAMLPWCDEIVLADHSASNVDWLQTAVGDLPGEWEPFWKELVDSASYTPGDFTAAQALLRKRTEVWQRSVFDLGDDAAYDAGTMFFVAESLTNYPEEFEDATTHFLRALKSGAPFAAAFMDSSEGYLVGEDLYPAVKSVTVGRVEAVLRDLRATSSVQKIAVLTADPLRDGYDGMIVAVGWVAGSRELRD